MLGPPNGVVLSHDLAGSISGTNKLSPGRKMVSVPFRPDITYLREKGTDTMSTRVHQFRFRHRPARDCPRQLWITIYELSRRAQVRCNRLLGLRMLVV